MKKYIITLLLLLGAFPVLAEFKPATLYKEVEGYIVRLPVNTKDEADFLFARGFILEEEGMLGSTITTINGGDKISDSRIVINTNFTNLNSTKIEVSTTTLPNITTLANLSTVGTVTSGTWNANKLTVPYGGTGTTTLDLNEVLLGNGTNYIKSINNGSEGQILSISTGVPAWSNIAVNQTLGYNWTGAHTWTTGTTTFNSQATFNGNTVWNVLPEYTSNPTDNNDAVRKSYVDTYSLYGIECASSSTLRISDDVNQSNNDLSYVLVKEIRVLVGGKMRVDFDLKRSGSGGASVFGRIYRNGTAVGTERSTTGTSYTTYREEISVGSGDLIQLYGKVNNTSDLYNLANFRLYFNVTANTSWGIVL